MKSITKVFSTMGFVKNAARKAYQAIQKAEQKLEAETGILLVTHIDPPSDEKGSILILCRLLLKNVLGTTLLQRNPDLLGFFSLLFNCSPIVSSLILVVQTDLDSRIAKHIFTTGKANVRRLEHISLTANKLGEIAICLING